jgi:hypothetical protein
MAIRDSKRDKESDQTKNATAPMNALYKQYHIQPKDVTWDFKGILETQT